MNKTDIPYLRKSVAALVFLACVLILDILNFLLNSTRDLCTWSDYVFLGMNIVALGLTIVFLHKEKQVIHTAKKDKEKQSI